MKKNNRTSRLPRWCVFATGFLFLFGLSGQVISAEGGPQPLRRIVVFEEGVNAARQTNAVRAAGGKDLRPLGIINAVAAVLPNQASERALTARFDVVRVDEDLPVHAHATVEIPWGVERVNAPVVWNTSNLRGADIRVAIIDTGIQRDHPDLKVKGGYLAITHRPYNRLKRDQWDDDHGHGTHVAGTVAASGNLLGVAPDAHLYAVKVLDKDGNGSLSDVISGIEWSIKNNMQIINLSLGASSGNQSFHDVIKAADQAGLIQVVSAGNSGSAGNTITYPAAYPETIAVAASDSLDRIASFSSRGGSKGDVDLAAPGVSVKSTWIEGGYRTLSGTSMAAPHVAGVAALALDGLGDLTPAEMWSLLTQSARDLGYSFAAQGYGLVQADEAIVIDEDKEAEVQPAFFSLSNLDPASITLEPGEAFTVSAAVTNSGEESATRDVTFHIHGVTGAQSESVTLNAGSSQTVSFAANAPDSEGVFTYEVFSSDDSVTGTLTVEAAGDEDPGQDGLLSVNSIGYSTNGGRNSDRHLSVSVTLVDQAGSPVSGASVTIELQRNGGLYAIDTSDTGSNGVAQYSFNNAPAGTYATLVTNVVHALEFDGATPENSFEK